jgi:selenide,water dikinase
MLPGVLSGQYQPDDMVIDLRRLCQRSGVRLIVGEVGGFDARRGELRVGGTTLAFDVASIGIGSVPSSNGVVIDDDAPLVAVKPMRSFLDRLDAHLARVPRGTGVRLAVVGGGSGGIEIAFTVLPYLRARARPGEHAEVVLVAGPDGLTPGQWPGTTRRVLAALGRTGITVIDRRVTRVTSRHVEYEGGEPTDVDAVVWATGAVAPPWLRSLGLPTDNRGFLLTEDTLRSTGEGQVFAVGDSGTVVGTPTPKAGVHAVRQGPVLWDNLRRSVTGCRLRCYRPQADFLRLLNMGDGRAIGEWKGVSFEGAWVWRLKDRIDRRFIARYRDD